MLGAGQLPCPTPGVLERGKTDKGGGPSPLYVMHKIILSLCVLLSLYLIYLSIYLCKVCVYIYIYICL